MDEATRLVQLFVYHRGERVDLIVAPAGSGKTHAVRTWLDQAGDAVEQIWLDPVTPESVRRLSDSSPSKPTFVVIDDHSPDLLVEAAIIDVVRDGSERLAFVITSRHSPSAELRARIADGTIRLTTASDLSEAYSATSTASPASQPRCT